MSGMKTRSASQPPSPRPPIAERRRRLAALPDGELCARCADGDELAWETLVHRYQRLVYAVPLHAGIQGEDAEEIFQMTFVKLAERVGQLRERERVRAWVVTTARRLTIDRIRSRRTRPQVDDPEGVFEQLPDGAAAVDEVLSNLEQRHQVRTAVLRLEARCQRIIHLLFYESTDPPRSYEDIAAELGMPVGSLGPTRSRCLAKLLVELRRVSGE